jgi:dolichol-phosphate mannosyltransferase
MTDFLQSTRYPLDDLTVARIVEPPTGALIIPPIDITNTTIGLSLIVPTYQESRNIEAIVELLTDRLDAILPLAYELIVVDDDSPDRTWEIAIKLLPYYPQLRVMRRVGEKGLATAISRGWQASRGTVVGVIDADLQHPPAVLDRLWQSVRGGADFAIASRNTEGGGVSDWSWLRRSLSRGAQLLGLIILPEVVGRTSDPMSGYFLVHRRAIAGIPLHPRGYKISLEVLGRGKIAKIAEVGYEFQERQEGDSKVTWRQYLEYLQHLIALRWFRSQRFLRFICVGMSGVLVDMSIFYLLHDSNTLHLPLQLSKFLAAEVAIANNFFWNDTWTFRDLNSNRNPRRQRIKRFVKFNLICSIGLILNLVILSLLNNTIVPNPYVANFLAIAIVTLWNYWINLKLSWRVTAREKD